MAGPELFQVIELSLSILPGSRDAPRAQYRLDGTDAPLVHVFITTCGESPATVMSTLAGAVAQDYPAKCYRVFVLDDANDPKLKLEVENFNRSISNKLSAQPVVYLARQKDLATRHYHKAGNLDFGIRTSKEDYGGSEFIAGLDVDMIVESDWLSRVVPHLILSADLAVVSPPQSFYNVPDKDILAQDASVLQQVLEPARDRIGCSMCHGSGYVMRRAALESIGGWPLVNIGEDILCSYLLNQAGWQTAFIEDELQFGVTCESFHAYVSQRMRWTAGNLLSAHRFYFFLPHFTHSQITVVQRLHGIMQSIKTYAWIALIVPMVALPLGLPLARPPLVPRSNMSHNMLRLLKFSYLAMWLTTKAWKRLNFGHVGVRNIFNLSNNRLWITPYIVCAYCQSLWCNLEEIDFTISDFFTTLLVGGCVCIPSETDRKNGLAAFVEKSQANWALLTPTVADLLDPATVPSLKYVTLGGETIKESTLRKWRKSSRVGINYGSAEVDVTHARDVSDETDILNVGHRLPSCLACIVDPDDPAVILPVGAVGDLVISGPTMARGYLNAPVKTAEVFLPVPQAWISQGLIEKPHTPWTSRAYRMGDLSRQMSDGSLQFVGRKDFQVKVNGQKVELGDIESKLSRHPDVSHCAVIYPADGPYANRLVAITQSTCATSLASRHARAANKTALTLSLPAVTEYLQNLIPSFMLPSVLIVVETMPFTPTMKIDRTRLKKCLSDNEVSAGSVPGFMHVSTALSGTRLLPSEKSAMKVSNLTADIISAAGSTIWKSISGHDNRLTDIGINSAQTMRLVALIRKQFGCKILFETLSQPGMTVRQLAVLLEIEKQDLITDMAGNDVDTKIEFLKVRVARHTETVLNPSVVQPTRPRHVFLTGATGYLGVQILCQLLSSSSIASMTVLVRTSRRELALERVRLALTAAHAESSHQIKLNTWPGDLSKPRLGLSDADWMRLSGEGDKIDAGGPRIDTIIHCGAVVNWTKSYSDLEAPNVHSTEELLKLVRTCHHLERFVFVSGGRYPNPAQDAETDLEGLYTDAAKANAYAQTKFVAERLVHNARRALPDKSISVVCPAYLIGGRQHGLANQDDYLWRVVWATVRIGAFNADERDQWLFVAQSDAVAEQIVTLTLPDFKSSSSTTLNVLDGLSVGKFWSIVSEVLAIPLMEETGDVWLPKVKFDMEETSDHLLWPLADSLESGRGLLTRQRCRAKDVGAGSDSKDIEAAVRANVEYLHEAGFFTGVKPE
ncbi:unnamed protein product [Cercospora beticola]|nr:unnamed protein product [Cercospora beticola]